MELRTTEEFVREAHGAASSTWKQRIEKEFPELFKTELKVGKWYKLKYGEIEWLMNYQGRGFVSYGFNPTKEYINGYVIHNHDNLQPVTTEEVESALIAEAKKRGYKKGVTIIPVNDITKLTIASDKFKANDRGVLNVLNKDGSLQFEQNTYACLYASGKWATILPEQKTIITQEKAVKIIAKKLKVSPESIVIE